MRLEEYFELAPNMRTAYIELSIYLISKSVTYRLGGHSKIKPPESANRIPRTSREILHTFGRRSTGEILYAFGRGRRSMSESLYIWTKGI